MTEHPITPPPELMQQWVNEASGDRRVLITLAARWGADQELEACCAWIPEQTPWDADKLRAARRPKPPSLAEQALEVLHDWCEERNGPGESIICDGLHTSTIRAALERLQELEDTQ